MIREEKQNKNNQKQTNKQKKPGGKTICCNKFSLQHNDPFKDLLI